VAGDRGMSVATGLGAHREAGAVQCGSRPGHGHSPGVRPFGGRVLAAGADRGEQRHDFTPAAVAPARALPAPARLVRWTSHPAGS
jgi:hypothetical protein